MGERFDVIVIGAGPGGYVAAIKCAKAGLRTAIVENRRVGGTCLNRGCIPAKAMIHASSLYREMQEAEKFGVSAERITFDYEKIVSYKEETTEKLCRGIEQLLKGNGVTILFGKGSLEQGRKVKVTGEESEEYYDAEHVILAAGSKPVILPIPGLELPGVLTSDELFKLTEMPESLVIIGGRCNQRGVCKCVCKSGMQSDHCRSDAEADSEYGQRDLAEFENDLKETRSEYSYFCLRTESGTRRGTVHLCIYGERERSQSICPVCVVCDWKMSEYRRLVWRRRRTGDGAWTCCSRREIPE